MSIDYSNIDSVLNGILKIVKMSSVGTPPPIPTTLIMSGVPRRSGLSAIKISREIIKRKSEAGLPVGVLPNGNANPDEIMERIRIEEWIKALQNDSIITVAIPPGITLTGAGTSLAGPVSIFGSTITVTKAYGVIQ